jgi:hypothetical protein
MAYTHTQRERERETYVHMNVSCSREKDSVRGKKRSQMRDVFKDLKKLFWVASY